MQITIQRLRIDRPAHVGAGNIIFNAPRPLYGEQWQGDFRHGIFYAAVAIASPEAALFIQKNLELDGWVCEYISDAHLMTWAQAYAAREGFDLADFDEDDIERSFFNEMGRVQVKVEDPLALLAL